MSNNGWFTCSNCGHQVKVLVPDWMTTKTCPNCGGTMRRSD